MVVESYTPSRMRLSDQATGLFTDITRLSVYTVIAQASILSFSEHGVSATAQNM